MEFRYKKCTWIVAIIFITLPIYLGINILLLYENNNEISNVRIHIPTCMERETNSWYFIVKCLYFSIRKPMSWQSPTPSKAESKVHYMVIRRGRGIAYKFAFKTDNNTNHGHNKTSKTAFNAPLYGRICRHWRSYKDLKRSIKYL